MTFFGGTSYSVQFFLAFVVVLGLIAAIAWGVRRFGTRGFSGVGIRGRQPRLAVVEYANVDGHRRLILVRRDNIEHLVMVGGPTDVVVEPGIVRAVAVPRDAAVTRAPAVLEPLPRAIPLPDGPGHGSWPLQPEPAAATAAPRSPRNGPWPEEQSSWPLQPQSEAPIAATRTQRDTLAALADEISSRPIPPRSRPQARVRPQPSDPRSEPNPEPAANVDRSMAEMTHLLEAALRKPHPNADTREARNAAAPSRPAPPLNEHAAAAVEAAPAPSSPSSSPPLSRGSHAAEAGPLADGKPHPGPTLYDSLEQEMASLLGRPTGKS